MSLSTSLVPATEAAKFEVVYSPKELLDFKKKLDVFIKEGLTDKVDYGYVTKNPRPDEKKVLLKPGAEKLAIAFGLKADYDTTDSTIDHHVEVKWQKKKTNWVWNPASRRKEPHDEVINGTSFGLYRYVVRCVLRNHRGDFMGSGAGVCSTLESKYCDRPRDLENTVFKMAQKRALVAAVLNGLGISGIFTQDFGDDEEEEIQQEAAAPTHQQSSHRSAPTPEPVIISNAIVQDTLFDPTVPEQAEWLIKQLDKRGVTDLDHQEIIASKLKGTPKGKLYGRIDELITAVSVQKNGGASTGDDGANPV